MTKIKKKKPITKCNHSEEVVKAECICELDGYICAHHNNNCVLEKRQKH